MSKATARVERAPGLRLWCGVAIIAAVILAASLGAGLIWFLADPLDLSKEVLEVLDQRASVVGMLTGMLLGATGLLIAMAALRAQLRTEHQQGRVIESDIARDQSRMQPSTPPELSPEPTGERGDSESEQGRSYGGDHMEFHHNTFHGQVIGKQVTSPEHVRTEAEGDERR
ncbi:hypothetical protein [Nonomuraea sp. NPDC049480]|uniref:hypothetical protein n=1 Tax=Nonomuraea sp. NPDC049480 TaxID=3364353 RepID=UPI00378BAFDE